MFRVWGTHVALQGLAFRVSSSIIMGNGKFKNEQKNNMDKWSIQGLLGMFANSSVLRALYTYGRG